MKKVSLREESIAEAHRQIAYVQEMVKNLRDRQEEGSADHKRANEILDSVTQGLRELRKFQNKIATQFETIRELSGRWITVEDKD